MKKILFRTFIVLIFLGLFLSCFVYYLFFTTSGLTMLVRKGVSSAGEYSGINIDQVKGSLREGTKFEDVELLDIKGFPFTAHLKIQRLFIHLTELSIKGLVVEVENARLQFPASDPIVFSGTFRQAEIDFNVFSQKLDVGELLSFFPEQSLLYNVSGEVGIVDLYVKGHYLTPQITGAVTLNALKWTDVLIENLKMESNVKLSQILEDPKIYGNILISQGDVRAKKTKLSLSSSGIHFSGLPHMPDMNIKGYATVDRVKIDFGLTGLIDDYQLILQSEPFFPEEQLLVMLATGKRWKGVESSYEQQGITPELARDFIDYFLFNGSGSGFGEKFGITDITIKYDDQTQGISLKKTVTDNFEVGYGVEQNIDENQEAKVTQTIGGEYQVTEKLSLGIEKELKQKDSDADVTSSESDENTDDKVFLKFNTKF